MAPHMYSWHVRKCPSRSVYGTRDVVLWLSIDGGAVTSTESRGAVNLSDDLVSSGGGRDSIDISVPSLAEPIDIFRSFTVSCQSRGIINHSHERNE